MQEFLKHVLDGLTQNDLDWQPRNDCNSIGWLAWHLSRKHDAQIASLMGAGQYPDESTAYRCLYVVCYFPVIYTRQDNRNNI